MSESTFGWATVVTVNPLTVRRDGESEPLGVEPDALVNKRQLVVNKRVWCQFHQRRVLIIGMAGGTMSTVGGDVTITPTPDTPTPATITLPAGRFDEQPSVVACLASTVPGTTAVGVSVANRTAASFTIYVTRTNDTPTIATWQATDMEDA